MKKTVVLLLVTYFIVFLITGCDGFTPSIPDDEYDEVNTTLAYIKVLPALADMKINQSKKFEVKAYNSESKLISIDPSQVQWSARYTSCYLCVEWKLSPTKGSTQTTFTPENPEKTGKYEVWANYKDKWAKATVEVY